jgi:hypothetical protein
MDVACRPRSKNTEAAATGSMTDALATTSQATPLCGVSLLL